jgi:aminopeptidase N
MEHKEDHESQKKIPLTKEEAEIRKILLSDPESLETRVHYNLVLVTRRIKDKIKEGKQDFEGKVDIIFDYYKKDFDQLNIVQHANESPLFLNFIGEVESFQINGKERPVKFSNQKIEINLSELEANKQNKISISFAGFYNHSGVGLHHYVDPSDGKEYLYTQFEPYDCNRLFPCFDQPDIKAVLELTVVAPSEWIVLSNEYEKEHSKFTSPHSLDNLHIFTEKEKQHLFISTLIHEKDYHFYYFNPTPRISTYLYALCAGPYIEFKNPFDSPVPLRIFFRESLKGMGEPEEMLRVTIEGLKWYKEYFGIDYPFSKYDQIFCPEYNMGAMENVGLVTFNEYYCWKDPPTHRKRTSFAITILHELAHMWFGNLVTMKWWDDLWLNESFATFISHLCLAESKLKDTYTTSWLLFGGYKGYAYKADQQSTTHPVMSDVKNTEIAETHFDEIVYEKGSSILKQMYYFIGDESFSAGLKTYFQQYKWTNTVFDDFIHHMIMAIQKNNYSLDLKNLCHSWLKKAGLNEVSLEMIENESGNIESFIINQSPCLKDHPNLQTHIIDILFLNNFEDINSQENKVFPRQVLQAESKIVLPINGPAPKAVILNYRDWAYFKFLVDKRSINNLKSNLHKMNDLLTKQLVYRSLFDLTRDSRMSALEYFDIISQCIKNETNEDIICTLLMNVKGIISNYIPLKYYEKYSQIMFESVSSLLIRVLTAEKKNKDLILHLLDFLISFAYSEEQWGQLAEWLRSDQPHLGSVCFDSNLLNQQNRFRIVQLLFRSRKITDEEKEKLLAVEIERDKNSDRCILAKLACHASKPDKAIKEALWNKFVNQSTSDSLYNMETLMGNFALRDQLDLVEPFLKEKFFEVLYDVGKNNDFFYIRSFVNSLAPSFFVEPEIILKLESLSEKVKELDQLKKCLMELIDNMKRCLKAHQLCEDYMKSLNK